MAEDVRCSVRNCRYWGDGNACHANDIEVAADEEASAPEAEMDAGVLSGECCGAIGRGRSSKSTEAPSSPRTQCRTFKPR